ncbi:MAG: hypothetical protein E5Y31_19455 [Mesorhizobium sp.]|nr:MAG: hypothetical protein E5Y31_19455 [Mesorhizobium sp.]
MSLPLADTERAIKPRALGHVISPLEGEMSPKATGGSARLDATSYEAKEEASALRETTPSGLPAISPSRGEIAATPQTPPSYASHRKTACWRNGRSGRGRLVACGRSCGRCR